MRAPVYDVYQMKVRHLPDGVKSAWLRTLPGESPTAIDGSSSDASGTPAS